MIFFNSANFSHFHKYTLLLLVLLVSAMLAMFNWIPHGQSPDETAHMFRASSLAHGNVFLNVNGESVGDNIDQGLAQYYSKFNALPFHPENKAQQINDVKDIRFTNTYEFHSFSNTALYLPFSYIPQAIAIFIGEKTHMKVWRAVNLARLLNIVTIISMLVIAARIYSIPLTACLIILMPMSLFQIDSATSDGLHIAITVLIASLFFSLEESFSTTKFICLCILIFITATHRLNLSPLVLLPLWIALKNSSKKYIVATLILMIAIITWFLVAMKRMPQPQQSIGMTHVALYYLEHPIDTIKIFWRTFTNTDLLQFYLKSFVGILGWLDYQINIKFIYITHIILWTCLIIGCWKNKVFYTWNNSSILLIIISIISILLTFAFLLVQWTKFPCTNVIEGVQGRYFIFPLLILCYAIEKKHTLELNIGKASCGFWLLLIYGVVSIFVTQYSTIYRYWITM